MGGAETVVVQANADLCCGAGQCANLAPTVFDLDDDGLVVVLDENPAGVDLEAAERAVRECPTRALRILATV